MFAPLSATLLTTLAALLIGCQAFAEELSAGSLYRTSSIILNRMVIAGNAGAAEAPADSGYEQKLNRALHQGKDAWGEELIASGGVTYDKIKDFLRPLLYSTGRKNTETGVHSLLFAADGGEPPYLVALADGSRICANICASPHYLEFYVGADAKEKYGSDLARLAGPNLDHGSYPILKTGYVDRAGIRYTQESFAGFIPDSEHLVAFVKFAISSQQPGKQTAALKIDLGQNPNRTRFIRYSGFPQTQGSALCYKLELNDGGEETIYLMWSPKNEFSDSAKAISAEQYCRAKTAWRKYWDEKLENAAQIQVPEKLVMDAQKNLLIQNLMMRWRYSIGAAVYHNEFFLPESSDAVTTLAQYGFIEACRSGLAYLLTLSAAAGFENWEKGEKLTHAAYFYYLTRDAAFIERNTRAYESFCQDFQRQMDKDPHGLLEKQRYSGDLIDHSYCTFHQTVCWRGMRDMAQIWNLLGRKDLYDKYGRLANRLRQSLQHAVEQSQMQMQDGSLFVPDRLLLGPDTPFRKPLPYDPITETRQGTYWNVAMPSYMRLLSDRDDAERLILSFYGRLAHGMTRNTFISGEGDNLGVHPDYYYRSSYGSCNSANNVAFLLPLRLMLVRESFDQNTGVPQGLFLAHATPREWLADGKEIAVKSVPTCFGKLDYRIQSQINRNKVHIDLKIPQSGKIATLKFKLRVPGRKRLANIMVNGKPHAQFDVDSEVIDLSGHRGDLKIDVTYEN